MAEPAPRGDGEPQLRRVLERGDLLALAWGAMVGWGWVILSGSMSERAGSAGSALAFVLAGLVIGLVGALYAEFTARFPRAGGELAFCFAGLGPRWSAACGWVLCLAYVAVCAFEAVALPRVLLHLFPSLETAPLYHVAGAPVSLFSLAVGCAGVLAIAAVNAVGMRQSSFLQIGGTAVLALAGVSLFASAGVAGIEANLPPTFTGLHGVLAVLIMTPFLFVGFDVIPQVAEETHADARQVFRVILLAIALAAIWYAAVQLSIGTLLPHPERSAAELAPVVAVERATGSVWAGRFVLAGGLFGILTSWNAMFVGAVRIVFAMGRGGMVPAHFGRLHANYATPTTAIVFVAVVSLAAPWLGRRALIWFVNAGSLATVAAYFLVACAYLGLRRRDPAPVAVLPFARSGWLGGAALVVTSLFLLLYVPGSPVALAWPQEWGIVAAWLVLGLLLCGPRLRADRFDRNHAARAILGRDE